MMRQVGFIDRVGVKLAQKIVLVALLVGANLSVHAQELKAYFSLERVKLGQEINLNLSVVMPRDTKISYDPYDVEIPASKWKSNAQIADEKVSLELTKSFKDTVELKGKTVRWIGKYSLIAWDTGRIVLPTLPIVINDSTYLFNEASFYVTPETIGVKDELFDIEEGFVELDEELTFLDWMIKNWYWLAGMLVVILGVIFWFIRKKKLNNAKNVKILSLKDRTLFAIDALDKRELWKVNQYKLHYTELSHIMRSYLSSRYNLNLLESTTFETKALLSKLNIPADTVDTFMQILSQADMVKFANSTTDEITVLKVSLMAKQIVSETSPLEIEIEK